MMISLDDDDNVALAETATIGGRAAANLCGGDKKSSSKTGEPGESLSSLTVSGSVGVRCLGRPPPNASLKVHLRHRMKRRLGVAPDATESR